MKVRWTNSSSIMIKLWIHSERAFSSLSRSDSMFENVWVCLFGTGVKKYEQDLKLSERKYHLIINKQTKERNLKSCLLFRPIDQTRTQDNSVGGGSWGKWEKLERSGVKTTAEFGAVSPLIILSFFATSAPIFVILNTLSDLPMTQTWYPGIF